MYVYNRHFTINIQNLNIIENKKDWKEKESYCQNEFSS